MFMSWMLDVTSCTERALILHSALGVHCHSNDYLLAVMGPRH